MSRNSPSKGGERRAEVGTNGIRYDWERSPPPSLAVVEAVAAATDRDPTELPPLAEELDTDALDDLLTRAATEGGPTASATFTYAGCRVDVDSAGELAVAIDAAPAAGEPEPPQSASAFQAGLKGWLADAYENGVPVEGDWVCRNGGEMPDYDVEITEIAKPDEDASERG